jgi:ferric-dicitrate binding protein FerR (iron transport regulator)
MNDCGRFRDLIGEYLDGTVTESRLDELKAHAAACAACAAEFRRSTLMQEVVADAFEPRTTATKAAAEILAHLPSRPGRVHKIGVWAVRGRTAVAAAILLSVGVIAGLALGRHGSVPAEEPATLTAVPMRVAGLEGTVLVRHDGSDTWRAVKSDSAVYLGDTFHCLGKSNLTLEVENESTLQIVENSMLGLKSYNGETRFHLEHGHCRASLQSPHGPFFISTPHGRVEALGTEFTVTVE